MIVKKVSPPKNTGVTDASDIEQGRGFDRLAQVLQHLVVDGQELGFAISDAGGADVEGALAGPEHVGFALLHALDHRADRLVGLQGNVLGELCVSFQPADSQFAPLFGLGVGSQQLRQNVFLRLRIRGCF